ncbi:MAG: response regulator transcription factor [Lentisphaeria bacterium]|nr:response regulator transcription factor [Lentisphaeria bacterium]
MTRQWKILIAEDEKNIRDGLVDALELEGYAVSAAKDGGEALRYYHEWRPDVLLLDIMMPVKNGYDICREIRRRDADTPVIMLTAKSEEIDKVLGLELGADDYVCKPFSLRELNARIKAALRRINHDKEPPALEKQMTITFGDVVIDMDKMTGNKAGQIFEVTRKEVEILSFFLSREGCVVKRRDLMTFVWGPGYHGATRTLDQTIANLRKKIEADTRSPRHIKTVYGIGYKFERG